MVNYGYEELSSALPIQAVHLCVPLSHPDKQIRVLDLDPVHVDASPSSSPALQGRLRVLSDLGNEQYSALSYVWAQEDPDTLQRENRLVIHCHNHQHEARLGPNCWSALWHLSKIQGPLTIWVDAICIDQKNDWEKSPQIALMCEAYTSAQKTYFWLGEAAKGTGQAMDYLSTDMIPRGTGRGAEILRLTANILIRTVTFRVYPHRSGIKEIFSRPWIKRLWTLQECLLTRKGVVVCGEKSIPWLDFVCALESIHYFHANFRLLIFDDLYLPWLNLANLSRWFKENTGNSLHHEQPRLDHVLGNLDQPGPMAQEHLQNIKWAIRLVFLLYVVISLNSLFILHYHLLWALFTIPFLSYIRRLNSEMFGLFSPASQYWILEELRNREVGNPKDVYNGMVGILGGDPSSPQERLHDVHRRLSASLIRKTQSLDTLLFANTCTDNNYCSWVINWNSKTPQLWGKALNFVYEPTLTELFRDSMRVTMRIDPRTESRDEWDQLQGIVLRIYTKVFY